METKKISLKNLEGKLNREEMKQIMGGTYQVDCDQYHCTSTQDCTNQKCGGTCLNYNGHNYCIKWPF
jgi:natural product precursor